MWYKQYSTVSQHYPGMVSMELMVLKAVPGAYTSDCPKGGTYPTSSWVIVE